MKIKERLMECKIKTGIKSDYGLAKALGCSRQRISGLMKGWVKPEAYEAIKIGELLQIHPLILLAEFEAENAKKPERVAFWENFGRRIKTGAVGMLVLTSTAFWSPEAKAGSGSPEVRIMYIMSNYGIVAK